MPDRIQLKRTKGWRKPDGAVVVARPTRWGNPWKVGDRKIESNADAKAAFQVWIDEMVDAEARGFPTPEMLTSIRSLRGKSLCCWCKIGEPCHADVLLEIANR